MVAVDEVLTPVHVRVVRSVLVMDWNSPLGSIHCELNQRRSRTGLAGPALSFVASSAGLYTSARAGVAEWQTLKDLNPLGRKRRVGLTRPKGGSDESDGFQARTEPGAAGRCGGNPRPIENRAPGPDELIDRGELDELVPHGQFMELRELTIRLRQIRERQGLSLTDVSERSGMPRAAISRLENGWNLNPTLDTLFRYATVLGAQIRLSVDECPPPRSEQV